MAAPYTIDASSLVQLQRHYPREVFPGIWGRMEELADDGGVFLPRQAMLEIERYSDGLAPWAKGLSGFVQEATAAEVAIVGEISAAHPGWVVDQKNEADPWVVANAAVFGRTIVTEESRKGAGTPDRNLRIPNVADRYGLRSLKLLELASEERWVF
jgi:hypothetical protein